jgi:outer membrane protein TolC
VSRLSTLIRSLNSQRRASSPSLPKRSLLARWAYGGAETQYRLPDRLPDIPKDRPELHDLETFPMQNRLDIQAARVQTQSVGSSLGLSKATRFINALDLGYQNNFTMSDGHEQGYEISVEIPIFNWGGSNVARAKAIYMQSVNRVAETAINTRSEVRESYLAYVTDYDIAEHYRDEVVPLRKAISDELLLRYNGMLASVFEPSKHQVQNERDSRLQAVQKCCGHDFRN